MPRRIHYGWVIAGTGTLCVLACLGFGRFALGMLLPSMAASLGLSFAQIGAISTANFLGYLASILACGRLAGHLGARRLIFFGLAVVATSMLLIARARSFAPVLVLYTVTGVGSAAANVPMMGLIARWFDGSVRGRAAGFVAIGSGFAIIASGQLIPLVNAARGAEGWRTSWVLLAAAVGVIAVVALALLRNAPEEKELLPVGASPSPQPSPRDAGRGGAGSPCPWKGEGGGEGRGRAVPLLAAAYALFGFTYAIYVTFIVTSLVRERGFTEAAAGRFWSWVGFLSLFSGPVFGAISDRLGRRAGLMIVFGLQMAAYALAAAPLPLPFLYLSIGCFGIVAWSIPAIMVAAVGDYAGRGGAMRALAFVTFIFGLGQITGPSVAGALAERTGSFASSFGMAAVLAAAAIGVCAFLRPAREERAEPGPMVTSS
jgi:MFS family permease